MKMAGNNGSVYKVIRSICVRTVCLAAVCAAALFLGSCYSVFSGGTGGRVADAESTADPKDGIADVDVYCYTDQSQRDSDYSNWTEGTRFEPATGNYYGHTTTESDGSFTISKLVWKNTNPAFGKDADTSLVYLLFYHENYGLVKGTTLIVSDSATDTIYQELTAIRKTTTLNLSFFDVATDAATDQAVYVTVSVPQTTGSSPAAAARVYSATVTGTGSISVSYPRYQNDADKTAGTETSPTVTVTYAQKASEIAWKACYNNDPTYAYQFIDSPSFNAMISGDSYSLKFYGKKTKLTMPTFSGQYKPGSTSNESDDGIVISMKATGTAASDAVTANDDSLYKVDCGSVTTQAETIGTSSAIRHGVFSDLGANCSWTDTAYAGKYTTTNIRLYVGGKKFKSMSVRSDTSSYTVQLSTAE